MDLHNTITEEEREEMQNELSKVLFLMFSLEMCCHAVEFAKFRLNQHNRLSGDVVPCKSEVKL